MQAMCMLQNVCKVAAAATPEQLSEALAALLKGPLVAPSWLAQAAPGAHVLECMLDVFDSLRCEGLDMAAAIDHLTGEQQAQKAPRRLIMHIMHVSTEQADGVKGAAHDLQTCKIRGTGLLLACQHLLSAACHNCAQHAFWHVQADMPSLRFCQQASRQGQAHACQLADALPVQLVRLSKACSASCCIGSGGATVRRVKVTGWCVAGMVATIAAVWAALQFPAADVRCITFGAQKVGNAAFAQAFR